MVLAGGRSSRLGGTPKAGLRFRESSLLAATVASAVARGARQVVVVGSAEAIEGTDVAAAAAAARPSGGSSGVDADPVTLIMAREEPHFGGPAAGIAAGFEALQRASGGQEDADFVLVLACDLPEVDGAVGALLAAAHAHARIDRGDAVEGADGIVAVDDEGRPQNLLAMYRTSALAANIERHRAAGDLDGLPVRRLVEGLSLGAVVVPRGSADDVDTWADAARHGIVADAGAGGGAAGGVGGVSLGAPSAAVGAVDSTGEGGSARAGGSAGSAGGGGDAAGSASGGRSTSRTPADDDEQRRVLGEWAARLAEELGLAGFEVDVDEVLGLAGVAAHAVRRPAAPLTTFVVGYAAGRAAAGGTDAGVAATRAGEVARRLAAEYQAAHEEAASTTADAGRPGDENPTGTTTGSAGSGAEDASMASLRPGGGASAESGAADDAARDS